MFFQTASSGTLSDAITIDTDGRTEFFGTVDVGSNELRFNDPDNSNTDVLISGSDPVYNDNGITVRCLSNPASGGSIFRVLSSGGAERLRVEHDGVTYTNQMMHVNTNLGVGVTPSTSFASHLRVEVFVHAQECCLAWIRRMDNGGGFS